MHTLYMKQKAFSLRGRFAIQDEEGNDAYHIEGSFMKLPKTFTVTNQNGEVVAEIEKKTFSFRPVFYVEAAGQSFEIIKEFTFFSSKSQATGGMSILKSCNRDNGLVACRKSGFLGPIST